MKQSVYDIEKEIENLSLDDQLLLIENLVHRLRKNKENQGFEKQLEKMATDPQIQKELNNINEEFKIAETDGLK
ncbi:MAG: hypothetical protein OEZ22_08840 [Spirochaetia bacterium]|nr:hypothetical protein [Spirochaetia bacterium]